MLNVLYALSKISFNKKFYVGIFLLLIICYREFALLQFQMEWDDYWVVINRFTNLGFDSDNISSVFSEFYHGQYSPINEMYYICIFKIFGYNPFYFHLFNLLLHYLNCILVFTLLKHTCIYGLKFELQRARVIASIATLLFAVHPLNVEPIAWLSASKIPLYSLFYLSGLLLYIKYLENEKKYLFTISVICFIISFGAKEQAVTFPLAISLFDFIFHRRLSLRSACEKIFLITIAILFGYLTIVSQGMGNSENLYSLYERIFLSFFTFSQYFSQSLIPIGLSYLYPFPFQPGEAFPFWLYFYPLVLLYSLFVLRKSFLSKPIVFGFCFFLIHILVALHLISISRFSVTADRYIYLSLVGFCFLIGYFLEIIIKKYRNYRHITLASTAVWFCFLLFKSNQQFRIWTNSSTLKKETRQIIRSRPDFEELKTKYSL